MKYETVDMTTDAGFRADLRLGESLIPGAGRGVFATRPIAEGDVIEVDPIVRIPRDDVSAWEGVIPHYTYDFGEFFGLALGFGTLYNHSYDPNVLYHKIREHGMVVFVARLDIAAGEELTITYNNSDPSDKSTPPNVGVPPYEGEA